MKRNIVMLMLLTSVLATPVSAQTLGASFADDVRAAGLAGLPFSWSADGTIRGLGNLSPTQQATLNAAIAAHNAANPAIPQTVTSMQAKVALSRAGLLTVVQAWVNTQSAEAQLIWNSTPSFSRNSRIIMNGAAALGLTQAQLDQLFITAAGINP